MNPIFTWIIAETVARTLARRCPKCRHKDFYPKEKLRETVPCKRCVEPIPPEKKT
jgi:hypothetical protein